MGPPVESGLWPPLLGCVLWTQPRAVSQRLPPSCLPAYTFLFLSLSTSFTLALVNCPTRPTTDHNLGGAVQTRLTALDLIGYAAGDERPRQFVHMPEQELEQELVSIKVSCTYYNNRIVSHFLSYICLAAPPCLFTLLTGLTSSGVVYMLPAGVMAKKAAGPRFDLAAYML